ncbi:Cupin 2 conserved barrel domain protein [Tepidanaerobacter acetatoxydans Re1]|uniref:Cupin 2 conserved barrel domain protein n=1 Tax=Tepidanaerobacter acetatoxydans (strain DSM 21804 / JCM 16047 / Re1) TaxID=1209989 RepID=F4LXM5_TEPAE|nr:dimethylsulfonioproprionate lyase family protein [Tepidanaerobacter acetatoxydans]AEE91954.1 Cupin 2 conserved barrel domain protein [Tepidanaerobacter acetatoxydans Re1]CCP26785.1 Cupin 2 conserved barrel domain protein [Tepidanaerobacter acetatoxydans Re1]
MKINNVYNVKGTKFPAGRLTRVIVGPDAPMEAQNFVMGHVTIYAGGSVPLHSHEQEEVYLIVSGSGMISIDNESERVTEGSYVYIPPNSTHILENTSDDNMIMVFCYSPKSIVEHWKQELNGEIK